MQAIRPGDRGDEVRDVQSRLVALGFMIEPWEVAAAEFAASTETAVRGFQQQRSILVDALVGPVTWEELVEAGYALGDRILYLRRPPFRGDDVRELQRRLNVLGFDPGREDGIFGDQTGDAATGFQRNVGLEPDGIVGPTTVEALARLRPSEAGPGRANVREGESLRATGSLAGRVVAIDAGHGPGDPGEAGPSGLQEHAVTFQVALSLAEELHERGAEPVFLRDRGEEPTAAERVDRARSSGADALVSIHMNAHEDPSAEGSSSYYFGRFETLSVAGQALAELVQEELASGTGLRDGRAHPKSFALLRETPMPAVQVEPCFITNPKEERLLGEDTFRREIASALARALERFFAGRV